MQKRKNACVIVKDSSVLQLKAVLLAGAILALIGAVFGASCLAKAIGHAAASFQEPVRHPALAQLCKDPAKWVGPVSGVKGILRYEVPDGEIDGGTPTVNGRFYSLSDGGGHSVTVYLLGQGRLKTGKINFEGDWVEYSKGSYRLEPNPGSKS